MLKSAKPREKVTSAVLISVLHASVCVVYCSLVAAPGWGAPEQEPTAGPIEDRRNIDQHLKDLGDRIAAMRQTALTQLDQDNLADVEVFHKGVAWALRYEPGLSEADRSLVEKAIVHCRQRLDNLARGKPSWNGQRGRIIRGFRSSIDGSTQPYGVIVPKGYDPARPTRLDVVLHGSIQPAGLNELQFMDRFDEGEADQSGSSEGGTDQEDFIELHPLGRVENGYRWAGETDVFEVIEAAARRYNIDRDRIVLRGMSMGASGTWHLGLKHPDQFVALGPYCGYVDTHSFSESPIPTFVKVGPLPVHQELGLHMLDSIDYAANAGIVPAIACMGSEDVFFQAHVLMGEAMKREGLEMVNLISPGTGHTVDPATHREQMFRIAQYADRGIDRSPKRLRFVTWTLKYHQCHWLDVLGLQKHYSRAELAAAVDDSGNVEIQEPVNITSFAIRAPLLEKPISRLRVGGVEIPLPSRSNSTRLPITVLREGQDWICVDPSDQRLKLGKRPGLQGPIDDAFTSPFVCVRGTGKPWNDNVQAWSEAVLERFAYEWHRYFRGELPIKNDTDVVPEDLRRANLILFGDPGSNRIIAQVLPALPIVWTREELSLGSDQYSSTDHAPALIHANPLVGGEDRYVVINSGHTFHEQELASLNYLLFPRVGDWAVFRIGEKPMAGSDAQFKDSVVKCGYFNEQWKLNENPRQDR